MKHQVQIETEILMESTLWMELCSVEVSKKDAKAAAGGNVEKIMKDAARQADRIMRRAGYY